MKAQMKMAVEKKDVGSFNEALTEFVSDIIGELSQWEISQLIQEIKFQHPGKKGRLASPFTEVVEKESAGKRGRPTLTDEEKIDRLMKKLETEKAKLIESSKYRELNEEEIKKQYA